MSMSLPLAIGRDRGDPLRLAAAFVFEPTAGGLVTHAQRPDNGGKPITAYMVGHQVRPRHLLVVDHPEEIVARGASGRNRGRWAHFRPNSPLFARNAERQATSRTLGLVAGFVDWGRDARHWNRGVGRGARWVVIRARVRLGVRAVAALPGELEVPRARGSSTSPTRVFGTPFGTRTTSTKRTRSATCGNL